MNRRTRSPSAFALAGALEPIWFLGGSIVFGAARPGYDLTHAISELGQQGSTNAIAWNVLGFGISGILYALFAVAIGDGIGRGWLFRLTVAQAVLITAGGTFSCDPGCPPIMSSWQGWAHTVVGLSFFAVTSVLPLVAWRAFLPRPEWRALSVISLLVGLTVVALFFAGPFLFGAERVGLYQRLTLGICGAWSVAVAVRLYRVASEIREPATGRTTRAVRGDERLGAS